MSNQNLDLLAEVPGASPAEVVDPGEPKRTAAFFDIDGTLIRGATTWFLARELYKKNYFGLRDISFALRQSILFTLFGENMRRVEAIRARAIKILGGRETREIEEISRGLYESDFRERVIPGTKKLVESQLKRGNEVWLVSATPDIMAHQIALKLGLTGAIGTPIHRENGLFVPNMNVTLLHGPAKAQAVQSLARRRNIDLSRSYAFSDSINDLKLLELVGHPRVVNPEAKLRDIAIERLWPVYDFTHKRMGLFKWRPALFKRKK